MALPDELHQKNIHQLFTSLLFQKKKRGFIVLHSQVWKEGNDSGTQYMLWQMTGKLSGAIAQKELPIVRTFTP